MAIYDHKYGELSYFRVFRAWGGKEYQEYVRIKRSRKAAYAKAQEIDARLARAQHEYCVAQAQLPEYHVRDDGSVRGLRRVTVTRKGRTPAEVFELRINVPWEKDIKRTTISIAVHGEQKAFQLAIEKIALWYGLAPDSLAVQAMQSAFVHYRSRTEDAANVAELALKKAKDEIGQLRDGLLKSFKRFTA